MSKSLAASKQLMQNYLSELLTEEESVPSNDQTLITKDDANEKAKLNKLLQQASVAHKIDTKKVDSITSVKSENKIQHPDEVAPLTVPEVKKDTTEAISEKNDQLATTKSKAEFVIDLEKDYRKSSFQAMFFDVAGLLIAVPLVELGGIHNTDKTNSLMGKPDWFKGVMLHRDDKINVVDTARWVMPEKCNDALINSLNYQYVIMLNNSHWGLMAEHLVDTVTLEQEDVKWLESSNKRPWLAGLVKERMCALLDVDALIYMLEEGSNINQ